MPVPERYAQVLMTQNYSSRLFKFIYFYDDNHDEGQHTVVTETSGSLKGRRVVRGREAECRDLYETTPASTSRRG